MKEYLAILEQVQLLSLEEEQVLWKLYKEDNNMEARMRLIEQYQPLVFKQALLYQSLVADVMDCVQEGTIGLIEAVERYDHRKGIAFSLYCLHRVRGRMIDFLRKEGKRGIVLDREGDEEFWWEQLPAEGPSIESVVEEKAYGELVTQALEQLPTSEKVVMEKVYLADHSVAHVADELECSNSYIHRLRRQGLTRMRRLLGAIQEGWE